MPALDLDPETLPAEERDELLGLLATKAILAEPETPSLGLAWLILVALGAAGLALLLFGQGLGVVDSPWKSRGLWIALPYALAVATLVIGMVKAAAAIRAGRLPWKTGRFLFPQGFLDSRRRPLRFRPIAGFTRVEIQEGESQSSPLRLYTIQVSFGDERETFHLFGTRQNVPEAALNELASHRDAALDTQRSEGGYRVSRRVAPSVSAAPRPSRRLADHPWKLAGLVGLLSAIPILLVLLPLLSLRAAEHAGTVRALRAAAAAYPYGWVEARVRPQIHARFEAVRASSSVKLAPELRAPMTHLLTYLEEHEISLVYLRLVAPNDDETKIATGLLEAMVKDTPGATAAPVVLNYQSVSLAGISVGQSSLARILWTSLEPVIPSDVMAIESEPEAFGTTPVDARAPVIVVASTIALAATFQGKGSRVFAALSFGYEASLKLPGEEPLKLSPRFQIPPPDKLSIGRFTFGDEQVRPLGSSGDAFLDRMDDSMVYTRQAELAASEAASRLAKLWLTP